MQTVEKCAQTAPVRVGIGTPAQRQALLTAGAERVLTPADLQSLLDSENDTMLGMVWRVGDIVLLVQSNLLTIMQMRALSAHGILFEAVGHEPKHISGDDNLRAFRRLKTNIKRTEKHETRGRDPVWATPSKMQVQLFVELWHSGMKRALILEKARKDMDIEDLPDHWVRDLVIKVTGSAARKADNPRKLPLDQWKF